MQTLHMMALRAQDPDWFATVHLDDLHKCRLPVRRTREWAQTPRLLDVYGTALDAAAALIEHSGLLMTQVAQEVAAKLLRDPAYREDMSLGIDIDIKASKVLGMPETAIDREFGPLEELIFEINSFLDAPSTQDGLQAYERALAATLISQTSPTVLASLLYLSESPSMHHFVADEDGGTKSEPGLFKFLAEKWPEHGQCLFDGLRIFGSERMSIYLHRDWVRENTTAYDATQNEKLWNPTPPAGPGLSNG